MATLPFAVEAGSAAAGYTGGLLNPADLKRIAHDLSAMPRKRIEGPDVPQARAVLVPLCHDSRTKVFGSVGVGKDVHLPLLNVF